MKKPTEFYQFHQTNSLISKEKTKNFSGEFPPRFDGVVFISQKNARENIIELLDNTGATVVKYKYDAWGNCKVLDATGTEITNSTHIGILNPFRYRSYYYDTETGFYFLKTRYYDPETGRFTTIDDLSYLDPESINGLNLYAYCNNNPVMLTDRYGCTAWWEWLIGGIIVVGLITGSIFTGGLLGAALVGAAIGAGVSLTSQAIFTRQLNWGQFALDIGVGAITGLLSVSGISTIGSMFAGAGIGGISNLASQLIGGASFSEINWLSFGISVVGGGISGLIAGAGTRNVEAFGSSYKIQAAGKTLTNVEKRIASGTYYTTARGMKSALTQANNKMALAVGYHMREMFTQAMATYGVATFLTNSLIAFFNKILT